MNSSSEGENTSPPPSGSSPNEAEQPPSSSPTLSSRASRAVEVVKELLRSQGPQPGSIIAAHLTTAAAFHPKDDGFRSLTAFLSLIPDMRVVSYMGTDRVWQLSDFSSRNLAATPLGASVWRALASPNSWRKITVLVHSTTGEWKIEPRTELHEAQDGSVTQLDLGDGRWFRVPPMPADAHLRVARAFAKRTDLGPTGDALAAVLAVPGTNWWIYWRQLLDDKPEILQSWFDIRDRELRRYIRTTLRSLGLTDEALERATLVPGPSEAHARVELFASTGKRPRKSAVALDQLRLEPDMGAESRQAILEAVARMTDAELFALATVAKAFARVFDKREE